MFFPASEKWPPGNASRVNILLSDHRRWTADDVLTMDHRRQTMVDDPRKFCLLRYALYALLHARPKAAAVSGPWSQAA